MKTKLLTTVAVLALSLSAGAQASLTSSGPLTVYDSVQDLTWTKDANLSETKMDWWTAVSWADNLNYAGYSDWVLPTISQLSAQFRTNLGGAVGSSITVSHNISYDLFTNVSPENYWSGSVYAPDPNLAWIYAPSNGYQGGGYNLNLFYAWAVRPGDVAAVPVPGAFWLFGSGLVGLMGLKRRGNIG